MDGNGPDGTAKKATPQSEWIEPFLKRLEEGAGVTEAALHVGINPATPYKQRKRQGPDSEFTRRWTEAVAYRDEAIEDNLADRMLRGTPEEVWHQGMHVGTKRSFDERAVLQYLKAKYPERWSERRIDAGAGQEQQKVQIEFVQQPAVEPDTTKGSD